MGQEIKTVEEAVINLERKQMITSDQAQTFLNDYHNQVGMVKDVNQFMENPSLKLFLKYYICNKYEHNTHDEQTQQSSLSKKELDALVVREIHQKIMSYYQDFQETTETAIEQINLLMIKKKTYEIKLILDRIIKKLLGFTKFEFTCRQKQEPIQIYDSELDFLSFVTEDDTAFNGLAETLNDIKDNCIIKIVEKNTIKLEIHIWTSSWKIIFKIPSNEFLRVIFSKKNTVIEELIYGIVEYIVMQTLDEEISSTQSNKYTSLSSRIKIFSAQYLAILQLSFKMHEELLKHQIAEIINETTTENQSLQLMIEEYFEENSENISLSVKSKNNVFDDLNKYTTKAEKNLQMFEMYREKIDSHDLFMDFDRYGQLKFVSSSIQHNAIIKLEGIWGHQSVKISNLLTQYKGLLASVKQASKGFFKAGVIEEKHQQLTCRLFINSNSILERIHIEIEEHRRKENEWESDEINESGDDSDDYDGVSLRNIEKEHPRIKEEGWLNMFKVNSKQAKKTIKYTTKLKTQKILSFPIDDIENPNLNVLPYDDAKLNILVWQVLNSNSLFVKAMSNGKQAKFKSFLTEIKYYYDLHQNPYHNYYHAVNVLHSCYIMTQIPKNQDYLTEEEALSVLVSGLCHDVGHTGFTNSFEIATFSQKALTYNDNSPLQNYHAAKTLEILSKEKNNFLEDWDRQILKNFKKNIIHNILSTDLKDHFSLVEKFREWRTFSTGKAVENTQILTATIVHTADLGGTVKEYDIAKQWSEKVNLQFMNQYEEQGRLGLKRSEYMKDLHINRVWYQNQSGFMKVIVLPIYNEIHKFYEHESSRFMVENGTKNLQRWQQMFQKESNRND